MKQNDWQCRWSPTLGELEDTHQAVWGTNNYTDKTKPTVFFGLYGLPDFYTLWRHKGDKHILWAGTDIIHLHNNYWLDGKGDIRIDNKGICQWIEKYCVNWCENRREQALLMDLGISAMVTPSFLGRIEDYQICYEPSDTPKLYSSVSGDNFAQYGWPEIEVLAKKYPEYEFHLYGNTTDWWTENLNVYVHGRVPKQQMNKEIKKMQGAIRMTNFDGFSEILAKSILWGQWPVSLIEYPYMLKVDELEQLKEMTEPNQGGCAFYRNCLNEYPWNVNLN